MSQTPPLSGLESILDHKFHNKQLLKEALIHSSAKDRSGKSFERLEFLGDRVLGLVVAELLFESFPKEPEGALGKRFASLVSRETLGTLAAALGIGDYVVLSPSEAVRGGRANISILADVLEALIAALYKDGGLEVARGFILYHWPDLLGKSITPPQDAKTRLQEWAQSKGLGLPMYEIVDKSGPAHDPYFVVRVRVEDTGEALGEGKNKRIAEQNAAAAFVRHINDLL